MNEANKIKSGLWQFYHNALLGFPRLGAIRANDSKAFFVKEKRLVQAFSMCNARSA